MKRFLGSASLREQGIWATLAVTLAVYGWYATAAWNGAAGSDGGEALGLLTASVVLLVILMVAVSIGLALLTPAEPKDERDLRIELVAARAGYVTLVSCVMLAVPAVFLWSAAGQAGGPAPRPVLIGHALFLCVVVAEAVKCATQLFLYRKGA